MLKQFTACDFAKSEELVKSDFRVVMVLPFDVFVQAVQVFKGDDPVRINRTGIELEKEIYRLLWQTDFLEFIDCWFLHGQAPLFVKNEIASKAILPDLVRKCDGLEFEGQK